MRELGGGDEDAEPGTRRLGEQPLARADRLHLF
jgi:hypothetical protein